MAFKVEYTAKIKSNMKRRVDAITLIPDNVTSMFTDLAENTKATKPVQGVIAAAKRLGDGTLNFLKTQCEITREWK